LPGIWSRGATLPACEGARTREGCDPPNVNLVSDIIRLPGGLDYCALAKTRRSSDRPQELTRRSPINGTGEPLNRPAHINISG